MRADAGVERVDEQDLAPFVMAVCASLNWVESLPSAFWTVNCDGSSPAWLKDSFRYGRVELDIAGRGDRVGQDAPRRCPCPARPGA